MASSIAFPAYLDPSVRVPETPSSASTDLQDDTADECLPFLFGQKYLTLDQRDGLPDLSRALHTRYLQSSLGRLPAGFAALDASRPWMLYWALNGLSLMGFEVATYRDGLISTLKAIQNKTGGFGGSHGQYSHLATSYAAVLALVIVGGESAYEVVDRKAMWQWLGSLKQPQGDFEMCAGGERDVRGAYCAMTLIAILNLPNDLPESSPARLGGHATFDSGLAEFISSCQTYEGGIGSVPGAEAHGAYAFCALACLCILGAPSVTVPKHLDLDALISWLSARQHAPEGGLAGRSNKVVDGCYSHWIGGCWPLLEAAVVGATEAMENPKLWNPEALRRYILTCCQGPRGGLRDKPSKPVDAYHSCYNLAGLAATQHVHAYQPVSAGASGRTELGAAFGWVLASPAFSESPEEGKRRSVKAMHPVFAVEDAAVARARSFFHGKSL